MKHIISKIRYTVLLLLPAVSVSAQHIFSLQQAIDYALENNKELKNAKIAVYDATSQIGETRANGLPQIKASFGYTNNTQIPVNIVPASVFDRTAPAETTVPVRFGVQHQSNFGVTASQLIWDGTFFIGIKAAKALREKVLVDEEKTRLDLIEQVTKSYYLVLVNGVRTALINANIKTVEATLNDTQALYENGFAEQIDVTRLKVQQNNLKAERQGIDRAVRVSRNILKLSMGMPVDEVLQLTDKLDDFDFKYSLIEIEQFDVHERIEAKQMDKLKNLAILDIKNEYARYIPKIIFNAGWGRNSGNDVFANLWNNNRQWFTSSSIGISVNVPIFEGLKKKYAVERKKYQLETLNNGYTILTNSLKRDLLDAREALEVNLQRLKVRKENMELARKVSETTRAKYKEGIGANLEVINAEDAYKEAEVNYLSVLYEAIIARIDLDKALGKLN